MQGMEKDVIILSVTVSQAGSFLSDEQRLNVALTRAKRHLIVVSNLNCLHSISPAFELVMEKAKKLRGGICSSLAMFIPQALYSNSNPISDVKDDDADEAHRKWEKLSRNFVLNCLCLFLLAETVGHEIDEFGTVCTLYRSINSRKVLCFSKSSRWCNL